MRCNRLEQPDFSFALAQGFISSRQRLTDCLSGFGLGLICWSVHRNPVAAAVSAGPRRNGSPNRPHNRLYSAPRLRLYGLEGSDLYSRWLKRQPYLTPMVIYSLFVNFITNRELFCLLTAFLNSIWLYTIISTATISHRIPNAVRRFCNETRKTTTFFHS